jgi:hypothetical protein
MHFGKGLPGICPPGDISTLKIILVPVDAGNNDITGVPGTGDTVDSTIFDFTSPCPKICDINSQLFQG